LGRWRRTFGLPPAHFRQQDARSCRRQRGSATDIDLFLAKLTPEGVPVWSRSAGGPAADEALGVARDHTGALYMTAAFRSPIDLGRGSVLIPDPGEWASALLKSAP
jgi:hypothetical protein